MLLLDTGSGLFVSVMYDDRGFAGMLNFCITITHGCKCGTIFCYSGICKRLCCENKTCCNQQNKNCAEKTFYHNFFLLSLSENNYALFFLSNKKYWHRKWRIKKAYPTSVAARHLEANNNTEAKICQDACTHNDTPYSGVDCCIKKVPSFRYTIPE